MPESLFNKVASLSPATLLKKRLWHRCFPVNFSKFLRTPFYRTTLGAAAINDLKELIDSFPRDSPHETFTTKQIKYKLQEQLKDEIVITESNGKPNIVTFQFIATKIVAFDNVKLPEIISTKDGV